MVEALFAAVRRHVMGGVSAVFKAFAEASLRPWITRASALGKMNGYAYAEGFDHVVLPG